MMVIIIFIIVLPYGSCYGQSEENEIGIETNNIIRTTPPTLTEESPIEIYIKHLEKDALAIEALNGDDHHNKELIEELHKHIIDILDNIDKAIEDKENLYNFIQTKGLHRVFSAHLQNNHTEFRTRLLLILKKIFDTVPGTIYSTIPINIMDKLLNIFEEDNNLAVKAHVLDLLKKWLPKNPVAQVRVMKVKGLDVFYHQISKLEIGVIESLIELFNSIIEEHLDARNEMSAMETIEDEKLLMYQRMGLIEHLSTRKVCDGLLNIFTLLWSHNSQEHGDIKILYELLKSIKPYCSAMYKRNRYAVQFFKNMLAHIKDDNKKEYFEEKDVNVAEITRVIEDYLGQGKVNFKDEF